LRATGDGGQSPHAAAQRSATQSIVEKIPFHFELTYLLVQPGNKIGVIILLLILVTTEDTSGALSQSILPFTYLAGMNLESIGQFGYCFFTF